MRHEEHFIIHYYNFISAVLANVFFNLLFRNYHCESWFTSIQNELKPFNSALTRTCDIMD